MRESYHDQCWRLKSWNWERPFTSSSSCLVRSELWANLPALPFFFLNPNQLFFPREPWAGRVGTPPLLFSCEHACRWLPAAARLFLSNRPCCHVKSLTRWPADALFFTLRRSVVTIITPLSLSPASIMRLFFPFPLCQLPFFVCSLMAFVLQFHPSDWDFSPYKTKQWHFFSCHFTLCHHIHVHFLFFIPPSFPFYIPLFLPASSLLSCLLLF